MKNNSKILFRGTSLVFLAGIIEGILGLFVFILLAKWLGPSEYGLIPLALGILTVFHIVADFGISGSMSKYIAQYLVTQKEWVKSFIKHGIILKIIFAAVVSLCCFFLSGLIAQFMHNVNLTPLLKIGSLIVFTVGVVTAFESIFRAFQRWGFYTISKTINSIIKFVAIWILVFLLGLGAIGAMWSTVIALSLTGLITGFIVYFIFYKSLVNSHKSTYKTIFKYSFPLVITAAAYFTYTTVDVLIIGFFKSPSEVAYYSVANTIYMTPLLVISSFAMALAPIIAGCYARKDHVSLQRILDNSQRFVQLYIFPIAFGLFFIAQPLITIILPQYKSSIILLQILSGLLIFKAIGSIYSAGFLTPMGFAGILARTTFYGATANVFLDLIFIPQYGALGAVIVTAVVHSITIIATIFYAIKKLGLTLKLGLKESLISSLLMLGILKIYGSFVTISNITSLCLVILFGFSTYIILIVSIKSIKKAVLHRCKL